MTVTFLHAADLDLDAAVSGVGPTPPDVTVALRDASLAAWDRLVRTAIERNVGMVVVAGGVSRDRTMSPRARIAFVSGVGQLSSAGIAVVVWDDGHGARGDGWGPDILSLPGVTLVGSAPVEVVEIGPIGPSPDGVTVYALGGDNDDLGDRVRGLHRTDASGFHLGLLRGALDDHLAGPDAGRRVSTDDLRATGLDYWAVGGDHHGRVVADAPPVVIAGTTQGRGFEAPESGPKGAMLVVADGPAVREIRPIALDTVRFASVVVDVTSLDRIGDIGQALLAALDGIAIEPGQVGIVRGILTGSGPVREDVRRQGAISGILATLARPGNDRDRVIWWDSIIDRSSPDLDLEAIRDRGDLAAEVLRLGADLRRAPDVLTAWVRSLDGDGAVLDVGPRSPSGGYPPGLESPLAEAEAIAISELERDGEA